VDVCFHEDIDTPNAVEFDFFVFVFPKVAQFDEIRPSGVVLLVSCAGRSATDLLGRRMPDIIPSAKIVFLSRLAASRNPLSDSIQEL